MRIAFFSECYQPVLNGVVTSITTLREALQACGHTVYVIAPGERQPDDDADVFRLPELPFPRHPYHFARPFPRLHMDFARLGVQIVHCHHPFTVGRLGADTARKYNLPMVYTAHTLYDQMAASSHFPLMRSMGPSAARGVIRRFCARADYVIAPTNHTRDALRLDGVHARFAVVPSGIVPPVMEPQARERVRAELGIGPRVPLILYVGRLGPEKRIDLLLDAVALLQQRGLPEETAAFHLALVGDGQCRSELMAQVAERKLTGRVTFVGALPHAHVADWYAAGDLFALPSPAETQGLVLVEAMACGLPCVAVNFGGLRELIVQNETGLLVPFSQEAFANALGALLTDVGLRSRLGATGRQRAHAFSPEAMTQGVLNVYQRVLALPRSAKTEPKARRVLSARIRQRRSLKRA